MVIDLSILSPPISPSEISDYGGYICVFVYPALITDEQNFRLHLRSDHFPDNFHSSVSPPSNPDNLLCGIFAESAGDHLIAITLEVTPGWNESGAVLPGHRFLHFVLESTLLDLIKSYDDLCDLTPELKEIGWDSWGLHTRMIEGDGGWLNSVNPLDYPDDVVGLRCTVLSEDGRRVRVYDFNRRMIQGNGDTPLDYIDLKMDCEPTGVFRKVSHRQVAMPAVCDLDGEAFRSPIHTDLPYRVAEYAIMGSAYSGLSMTVDGLVMTTVRIHLGSKLRLRYED